MSEAAAAAMGEAGRWSAERILGRVRRLGASVAGPGGPPAETRRKGLLLLVAAVEIGLVLATGSLIARIAWTVFAPLPVPSLALRPEAGAAAPAAGLAGLFAETLAGAAPEQVAASAPEVETALDLTLFGTWIEADGTGTAIIQLPGAEQRTFRVGDAVCCGAVLREVHRDRVVVSRGGVRETLRLPGKEAGSAAPPPAPAGTPQPAPPQPAAGSVLGNAARIAPAVAADGRFALEVSVGPDLVRFRSMGLRNGDKIVAVNGRPIPQDLAAAQDLLAALQGAGAAALTIERGGAQFQIEYPPPEVIRDEPAPGPAPGNE